jgi:polysaccharide biosynthesis/export protein
MAGSKYTQNLTRSIASFSLVLATVGGNLPILAAPLGQSTPPSPGVKPTPTAPGPQPGVQPTTLPQRQTPPSIQPPGVSPVPTAPAQPAFSTPLPTNPSSAAPGAAAPTVVTDDGYILGPGDRVRVDIFGLPEYSSEAQVLGDGSLNIPLIGAVPVQGLSVLRATETLTNRYTKYIKKPNVTISVITARPLKVAIAGEIIRPGAYPVGSDRPLTISGAIQLAGGLRRSADIGQVEVRRPQPQGGKEQVLKVDLWQLIQSGNTTQDLLLRDGDTVYIPAITKVDLAQANQLVNSSLVAQNSAPVKVVVNGEVFRPGPYILASGSQGTSSGGQGTTGQTASTGSRDGIPTLTRAIQTAGGIKDTADIRLIQVTSQTSSGPLITTINFQQLLKSGDTFQDIPLQDGDTITVPVATALSPDEVSDLAAASISPATITVNVVGEVTRPGTIQVPPNTPLNQAILAAGGFNEESSKANVQLVRLNQNGSATRQAFSIDLAKGIDDAKNPLLKNNDTVLVSKSPLAKGSSALRQLLGPIGGVFSLFRLFGL